MSEFHIEVVELGEIAKHPNADTLSITHVNGYPVILRTGDFKPGDRAVYVPVDAIVPRGDERWAFLGDHRRIRAKKLRGVFSMGLLTAADPAWPLGTDFASELGITKWDPMEAHESRGPRAFNSIENEPDPGLCPVYDIEGLRRYRGLLVEGEPVSITEKIHGANARFVHDGDRLWVGSRTCIKRESDTNMWWQIARRYDLARLLGTVPGLAIYGEVYGQVQDLTYGALDVRLVCFDILDTKTRRWFDVDEFLATIGGLGLPAVPELYRGPWRAELAELAEGLSTMPDARHVREGIVVKPLRERSDDRLGRVFLKLAGEGYLLRKGG